MMHAAGLGGLAHARALLQRRAELEPLLLAPQPGERRAGEPVERLATGAAPEPPQPAGVTPGASPFCSAMRAVRRRPVALIDDGPDRMPPINADKGFSELRPLCRCQPFKLAQKLFKVSFSHPSALN